MSIEKLLDDPETCMADDDEDTDAEAPESRRRTERISRAASRLPQVQILSRTERNRLIRLARQGDEAARSKVALAHIPLAIKMARLRSRNGVLDEDVLSSALVGVMNGVDRYDPDMSQNSSAYIAAHVVNEVRNRVITDRSLVTIKNTPAQQRIFNNLSRAKRKMRVRERGRLDWASAIDLSKDLNVAPEEIQEMEARMNMPALGLDVLDKPWVRALNPLIDDDRNHFDEIAERDGRERMRQVLRTASRNLSERERDIVRNRLLSKSPEILETLGQRHGVTRERIRQIEERIMEKLRAAVIAINPDLARDHGWTPENDAHDEVVGEPRITKGRRRQGQRGEWIMVVDADGEELASYLKQSDGIGRAEAYLAGHRFGRDAIAIDTHGLAIVVHKSPRRYDVVHHEVVLSSHPNEMLARAWVDGMRFGYRSSALREELSHEQRKRWRIPLRSAGVDRPAWDHGIEDEDDEAVDPAADVMEGHPDTDGSAIEDEPEEQTIDIDPDALDDLDPALFEDDAVEDHAEDDMIPEDAVTDPTARDIETDDAVTTPAAATASAPGIDDDGPVPTDGAAPHVRRGPRTARRRSERAVRGFMQWHAARTKPRRMGQ